MAGFTGNPRIWSQLRFVVQSYPGYTPYYLFSRAYKDNFYDNVPYGAMYMTLRADHKRIAFSTSEWTSYSGPSNVSRIYTIVNPPEGQFATLPELWNQYGVSQAAQGFTVPNVTTDASPLWDLTGSTTPSTNTPNYWSGEWSDDGTIFASLSRPTTDLTKVYLSVKQNGTTLVSRQLLGITHLNYWQYQTEFSNLEIRMLIRSVNEIWLFHVNESSSGAGDRRLYLSIWNGSAIASTTQINLGTYDLLTFDAIRGTTGLVYLIYALADLANQSDFSASAVNGRSFVRTINETTKAVSAVLNTSPILRVGDPVGDYNTYRSATLRPGDRLPSNRVFPYKGKNYLVHMFAGQAVVVYTYTDADPSNVTLLRWGFLEKMVRWYGPQDTGVPEWGTFARYQYISEDWPCGCLTGIEYDPDSDTAFLVTMMPNTPNNIQQVLAYDYASVVDNERVYVTRHWQALDAPTWNQQVDHVAELPDYVPSTAGSSYAVNGIQFVGYVPSRLGTGALGMLFIQSHKYVGGSNPKPHVHVIRTQCWHDPIDIDAEIEVILEPQVSVSAARTYEIGVDIPLLPAIDTGGVRNRSTYWNTYWSQVVDVSVNGEVHIDLQPTIEVAGALAVTHLGEVEIDFNESLEISVAGEVETTFLFAHRFWSVGVTFLEEFMSYMNETRLEEWGRPPIQIMGMTPYSLDILKELDIAQRHCDNMVAARWYAHGAEVYPIGWQTASQRISMVSDVGAENIQFRAWRYELVQVAPTAHEVYLSWYHSPPHYANMMTDWDSVIGPGETPYVFHSLAFTYGPHPRYNGGGPPWDTYPIVEYDEGIWGDPRYLATYWTDNFLYIKEAEVQATLVERWQMDELFASLLEQRWAMSGLVHLSARHETMWSMPLHAEHEVIYGSRIRAEHIIQNTHSLLSYHESMHTNSQGGFPVAFLSPYSLDKLHAVAENELRWSRTVAAQHTLEYDEALRVARIHDAPYGEFAKLLAALVAPYGTPIPVAKNHAIQYAIQRQLRRAHVAPVPLGPAVKQTHEAVYDLLLRNPARRALDVVYDLMHDSAGAVFSQPQSVAMLNGRSLEIEDGYITCDYESPGYVFECGVPDLEFVRGAAIGDRLDVLFEGTPYVFFLSNLSSNTPERSAAEKVTIKGLSPIFALDAPYAETVTYAPDDAKSFSSIIQEALGLPVDFSRHIDWMVPYGRAQSASQTPLGLVKGFLESIGSRLLSNPDGSLYVLPRYPVGFDAIPSGVPPHALDETNNVFTRSSTYDYARGYNRFRVRDSDAGYGDMIEFDQSTSIATVWVSPYRASWRLDCTLTPGILLDAQGEVVEEKEEVWDFQSGSASASYPILELVSMTWLTDSLGGVSFEPHSTKVSAPVTTNFGYGLAKVVYRTKCSKFLLTTSTPIEATQLIIVEL